jgi:hypothetical protein
MRTIALALLVLTLPGCVAAIGNTGYGMHSYPYAAAPLLQERVAAATRIVDLRQRQLDTLRAQAQGGNATADAVNAVEVQLEEAKLRLIECRIDLSAAEAKHKD